MKRRTGSAVSTTGSKKKEGFRAGVSRFRV